jgi:hypothetical protein
MKCQTMLTVRQRQPGELTAQANKILDAIRANGDWMNRSDVAQAIGKKRLTPYDMGLLDELATAGLIEATRRDKVGFIPFEWVYRSKPSE